MSSLLLRGAPMPGESLSSFRQRIWGFNGYSLFPVFSPELRRSDPDLQRSDIALSVVAGRMGLPLDAVRNLTLWSHPLLENAKQKINPRWVVPLKYGSFGSGSGAMLCPMCLSGDKIMHFRSAWRFSAHLACPTHSCRLIECCPHCRMPPWPHGPASLSNLFKDPIDIDECPRCRMKLRDAPAEPETDQVVVDCSTAIAKRTRLVGSGPAEASLAEQFAALRALMGLALTKKVRTREKLKRVDEFGAAIEFQANATRASFDRTDSRLRRLLMSAACPLLKDWPSRFLDFSDRAEITAVDFSECWTDLPTWMQSVVAKNLGQPGRFVTASDVRKGIALLASQGRVPTMESVGRLVGSKDAKAVRDQLQKRTVASSQELDQLIAGLHTWMENGPKRRVTSTMTRARDVVAILLALLTRESIRSVLTWPRTRVVEVMSEIAISHVDDTTFAFLSQAFSAADSLHQRVTSMDVDDPFLTSFRGRMPPNRGPAVALRAAMVGMDPRLLRRVEVFHKAQQLKKNTSTDLELEFDVRLNA